jgi:ComF family protein
MVTLGSGVSRSKSLASGSVRRAARFMRSGLTDLVFPPSCVSCNSELGDAGSEREGFLLCRGCLGEIDIFAEPMCERCGAPVPAIEAEQGEARRRVTSEAGCHRCRRPKLWFSSTVALGNYEGCLKALLLRMKSAEGNAISLSLARLLWQERGDKMSALKADVVAPIPLHWRRRLAHRTNSSAVIAEVVSTKLSLPRADGLLRRTRSTQRQSEVTPSKRWGNVRKAFALRAGYHLVDAHVLLVDDILTTGATCSEAARTLLDAGAARVSVVVVARAMG